MSKRKIPDNTPTLDLMPDAVPVSKWNAKSVIELLTKKNKTFTTEERDLLVALTLLIRNRINPDDYEILYRLISPNTTLKNMPGTLPPIHHLPLPPDIIALVKSLPDPSETGSTSPSLPSDDLPFSFDP